ncbi:MAG: gamma-glutamyltransferase [Myxococcota bacterium]
MTAPDVRPNPRGGMVAAGSASTADIAATILARGGNAIDAAVAACFGTAVGEPSLTSLAGGGMIIVREAETGRVSVCDCFANAPRHPPGERLDYRAVDLDFGPTTQRFFIGAGAAAVPGVIPGLCTALERWGSMDLTDVVAPACDVLRAGATMGDYQGFALALLGPILTDQPPGRALFQRDGRLLTRGDHLALPQLADHLEAMARSGWRTHYADVLGAAMLAQFGPRAGGLLTPEDLADYEVYFKDALHLRYHGHDVYTMPALGGAMVAIMLRLLAEDTSVAADETAEAHTRALCDAMAVADEARPAGMAALANFDPWRQRFAARRGEDALRPAAIAPPRRSGPGNTTHISVIDAAGNACGITFSYGEGNGHFVGDAQIMMNNLLGEEDIVPGGPAHAPHGQRLTTMMSPTIICGPDGREMVLGSGGANRIRSAIVQAVRYLIDGRLSPEQAVAAPRVHFEGGVLNAEVFDRADDGDGLMALEAPELVRFTSPNMFFGGVHLVERQADGNLRGAGDPRRGGSLRRV